MTVLSTLRQRSQPTLSSFAKTYATHRPLIQRILTAGFILHVLSSTFGNLSTRTPPPTSKGKAREQSAYVEAGKPPRVAVRLCLLDSLTWLTSYLC
jgi:ATP-binding cassette subfamily D (ALD) long-chain fatty acid import protein